MDLSLNGAISNFQKKIGTYDKANWEIIVEKQSIPQISENSSIAKLPTDLLDVDLIRGSTFTKTKPGYHWTQVTSNGLLKLVFFPFYYRWWKSQISIWVWLFMALYFLQLFGLVIYLLHQSDESLVDVSWPEAFVPFMAMILVGELYIHVVSSNFTKPMAHKMKKTKKRSQSKEKSKNKRHGRNKDRKKGSKRGSPLRNIDIPTDEGIESYDGRRINDTSPERLTSREGSVERALRSDEESILRRTEVDISYGSRTRVLHKDTDGLTKYDSFHFTPESSPDSSMTLNCKQSSPSQCENGKTMNSSKVITENKDISHGKKTTSGAPPKVTLTNHVNKKLNSSAGVNRVKHSSSGSHEEDSTTEEDNSDSSNSSDSTFSEDDEESTVNNELVMLQNYGFLNEAKLQPTQSSARLVGNNDQITVSIWHGSSFKKLKLTFFEIGLEVVKQVENRGCSSDYLKFSMMSAFLIGILPMMFRVYQSHVVNQDITFSMAVSQLYIQVQTMDGVLRIYQQLYGSTTQAQLVIVMAMIGRIASSFSLFFMLCVAEGTYKKRYMYAKFFSALTSTRRARRNQIPHFRLHKVKNIKAWLSLRSFLKKRGPQRSVDTIVSAAFLVGVLLLVLCCVQFLSVSDQKDHFLSYFFSWELSTWGLVIGVFLIRFIALGSDINRKYRNSSVLLTEQINLYLQMEKYPEKKEEFLIANNVLKLASDLLKELDSSFKISGFIMNPLLSNITRVVVLSLFSGVMSDILGFRLRLWKIKA